MSVFWMGLTLFSVILISFLLVLGITKGVAFVTNGGRKDPVRSNWIPRQVYSGDDLLGHPDLKKMSDLQEINEPSKGTEKAS